MKVRPIHFVPDLPDAVRFYEALGLQLEPARVPDIGSN
jgi:hypothetical protein